MSTVAMSVEEAKGIMACGGSVEARIASYDLQRAANTIISQETANVMLTARLAEAEKQIDEHLATIERMRWELDDYAKTCARLSKAAGL